MTPQDLESRAAALYGARWQTALARRVRVDPRAVRFWRAGKRTIPAWLGEFLNLLEKYPDER